VKNAARPHLASSGSDERGLGQSAVRTVDLTGSHRHLRAALAALSTVAESFGRGARRTLPFLLRQRLRLKMGEPAIGNPRETASAESGPSYMVLLSEPGGNAWASLTLNGRCLARVLEGSLGNSQVSEGASLGATLTLAQRVLIAKIAQRLGQDLVEAVRKETRLELVVSGGKAIGGEDEDEGEMAEGLYVELSLEGEGDPASIILCISAEALDEAVRESDEPDVVRGDPRIAEALGDVEVPLVAELGRLSLGLRRVMGLQVGQILRLPTLVENPVPLTIGGVRKFQVAPVTSRGQLAVQIVSRHGS